ncbi:MAG: glycosyltransferase [Phycisphaerae bacterium]|jgi:glycosyltransferase involved in cell wall biosynthesis
MKKKLLVLTSTFPRWENDAIVPFVYELSKRLTSNFEVYVLMPGYPGAKAFEVIDDIKVYRFRYFFRKFEKLAGGGGILPTLRKNRLYYFVIPFFMAANFFALRKTVKKLQPDVIHAHWIIPQGFIAALMKKLYKVPFLVTAHGGDVFGLPGKCATRAKRFTLKKADKITAVSGALKSEILASIDPNLEIQVVSMGVDSEHFSPDKKDISLKDKYNMEGPFLLFVGRLAEKKGVRYLIEAMPQIIDELPKTKLLIVGGGVLEENLKKLTDKLGLSHNVIFTGRLPNSELPKYYATADIFIGPSVVAEGGDTEGLGLTFIEAAMSGSVPVATNVGGVSDAVEDGKTGFLVEQKSPSQIAEKIIALLQNKTLIISMAEQARDRAVKQFDWKIVAGKYSSLLKSATGDSHNG